MLPATLAWQMSVVTIGYAALILSDSAVALGLVSSATGVSMLICSPIGGVVADRLSRRAVMFATQGILGVASGIVTILILAGLLEVWHLAALGFVQGVAFSFNVPARHAYIADLVGPRLMRNAVALNNAGMNFCRVAGPAIAGSLLAVPAIDVGGVFVVMTAMYALVIGSLLGLPARSVGSPELKPGRAGGWEQLVEGIRYVRSSPVLVALLGLALVTLFFGMPHQQLMPLFSERVFAVGAFGLGILMAASGVGALLGSLAVAALSTFPRQALLQLGFGVGFGLTLFGFALAPSFGLAVALLGLVGFTSAAYISINNTLVMGNTDPRLYGRVMSIYMLTFAITPVAALPMAWVADLLGGRIAVAGAGLLVAGAVVGAAALFPTYRHIR
jgi:MFS family permease